MAFVTHRGARRWRMPESLFAPDGTSPGTGLFDLWTFAHGSKSRDSWDIGGRPSGVANARKGARGCQGEEGAPKDGPRRARGPIEMPRHRTPRSRQYGTDRARPRSVRAAYARAKRRACSWEKSPSAAERASAPWWNLGRSGGVTPA